MTLPRCKNMTRHGCRLGYTWPCTTDSTVCGMYNITEEIVYEQEEDE